jgi:site-specific DNA recombinase
MNVLSAKLSAEFESEPPLANVAALHQAGLERYAEQLAQLQDALAGGINAADSDPAEAMRDLVETVTVRRDTSRPGGVEVEIAERLTALAARLTEVL